jgi:peptide/nickel transport system substrate-binding protein
VRRRAAAWLVALALLAVAGCAGGSEQLHTPGAATGGNDINPKPREALRDGGDLRWPLDTLPDNYNYNQFDGSTGDAAAVLGAVLPSMFVGTPDGGLTPDTDYLEAAELVGTAPQAIVYTINPRATWSDGTSITWRDFEAQWKALNGTDHAYLVSGTTGYEDIASVARGRDDKQVVVTFARTFAEWKSLFSPLYPARTNSDPTEFNTGWVNALPVSAGPFRVDAIDLNAKTITLRRDERWWGRPPKLDRIIYRVLERAALADALANNEIDFYAIGSSVDLLRRAQAIPGVVIRQSPNRTYNHITFNGAPGAILSDVRLRRAVAQGIDRLAVTRRLIGQIVPDPSPSGNHIYAFGSKDYRDNSDVLPYDPAAAERVLDELGWLRTSPDGERAKDGRPLRLRLVESSPNPIAEQIDRTVQEQLRRIGVTAVIQPVPIAEVSKQYKSGNFDLVGFAWANSATPFSASRDIYATPRGDDVRQNYGRVASPEIDDLFEQGLRELDDTKRAEIGNRVDRLIWQEVHHLPMYPATGASAVRSTLANFGAFGYGDIDYVNAGYVK